MFLLHEPDAKALTNRRSAEVDAVANVAEDYEDQLIWLLSRMEYSRQSLEVLRASGQVMGSIELADKLIELVVAFSDEHCAFAVSRELDEAAARIRDFRANQAALRQRLATVANNGAALTDSADQLAAKRCFSAFHDAVFAYFIILTGRFPTSRAALPWVEAAASFVVDLKKLSRESLFQC